MELVISLLLALTVLAVVSLREAYGHLPVKELKRRTREDDLVASQIHKAAVYGTSLRAVLWVLQVLAMLAFFVYSIEHLSSTMAYAFGLLLLLAAIAWLPVYGPTALGVWLAAKLAPVFGWLMQYLHSPIAWTASKLRIYWPAGHHTSIFDKADLLELLNHQNKQADNRISEVELELTFNALAFGDKLISDYLLPKRRTKSVGVGDSIGPILMDELHASGQSRFPVYDGKKDNIVGTLYLRDLVNTKASAVVRDVMRPAVYYIHEDQTLMDALQAILRTHHHLLIVVNDDQNYTGVINIEDVLGQVVGQTILDEFDQYDDRRAVAQRGTKLHKTEAPAEPAPSDEATEVIE